jgi:hypothetical protein
VRIVRRGSGPVVTWRRAQMVLLSAQAMDVAAIAKVAFLVAEGVVDDLEWGLGKRGLPPGLDTRERREHGAVSCGP